MRARRPETVLHAVAVVRMTVVLVTVVGLLAGGVPAVAAERRVAEAEVAFAYGLAALHRGEESEAERLLSEAVEADPEHGGAWYWLGRVRLVRGDDAGAVESFRASLAAVEPPPVERAQVEADLARARSVGRGGVAVPDLGITPAYLGEGISLARLPRWETRLGLALGSDSNPALAPDEALVLVPGTSPFVGSESDPVVNLDARFETHPFYDRRGWSLGLGVEGRQGLYDELDALDFRRLRAFVQLAWGGDPAGYLAGPLGYTRVPPGNRRVSLLLQGAWTDDALDGETFLDALDLAAALVLREGRSTATQLDLHYRDEEYDETLPSPISPGLAAEASGEVTSARVSQYIYFAGRNGYVRLGYLAGRRDAGAPFDADLSEASAEVSVPVGRRVFVHLAAKRSERDFDEIDSHPLFPTFFADRPREDTFDRFDAAVSWAARRHLWLTGRATVIDRTTELGAGGALVDLDYERTVFSLGIRWFFAAKGGPR